MQPHGFTGVKHVDMSQETVSHSNALLDEDVYRDMLTRDTRMGLEVL